MIDYGGVDDVVNVCNNNKAPPLLLFVIWFHSTHFIHHLDLHTFALLSLPFVFLVES